MIAERSRGGFRSVAVGLAVIFAIPGNAQTQERVKFHQGVEYRIEAVLDEDEEHLRARAEFTYTHNGYESLDTLFFHQHLNAFRPHSAWASRELEFDNRRFADLGPDEHAFERLLSVTMDGTDLDFVHPGAPDSTVVAVALAQPLEAGEQITLVLDWVARPAVIFRRQGRMGRQYDFAQWYPRIAVFDEQGWQVQPLLPQGEFYGEFATFDVTLDLAADQVMAATGVPASGDPGWAGAAAPGATVAPFREAFYEAPHEKSLGLLDAAPANGRKRVRWYAEDVHHFAWSTNPDYIYEGGTLRDISLHVLYKPGDEESWGNGIALERMVNAVSWLETVYGTYPYPQVSNVHRLDGGGTEFPMMVMNGSASQGLITHEIAHIYSHGILANNEWRDAWLDEGLVSFVTSWYSEEMDGADGAPRRDLARVASFENDVGTPQPVALPSADYLDSRSYGTYSYSKGSAFFYMLRELMGVDDFRRAMRLYYRDNAFEHVNEYDFRVAAEAVYGSDLSWFFHQWLHTTGRLDYELRSAVTRPMENGRWITEVEVARTGANWMPVILRVGDKTVELASREAVQRVSVMTAERPEEAILDPGFALLEVSKTNNRLPVSGGGSSGKTGRIEPAEVNEE